MTSNRSIILLLAATACLSTPATPALAQSLFIAGDSTASDYVPEQFPGTGWGQVLGDFYAGNTRVVDLAQSGRSAAKPAGSPSANPWETTCVLFLSD